MSKEKLILPISILLGCIVLGGFYYLSEVNKQQGIERLERLKMEQEQALKMKDYENNKELKELDSRGDMEIEKLNLEKEEARISNLENCLSIAKSKRDDYMRRLISSGNASVEAADAIERIEDEEKNDCYKKYQ